MVRQTIDAIYEKGMLRSLTPLTGLPKHGAVGVTVTLAGGEAQRSLADCVGILPDSNAQ